LNIGKGILVVSIILFASSAVAQIDPGPDGIGVYFDTGATTVQVMVEEETLSVTAYLILTRPTLQGTLYYWEATVATGCGDGYGSAEVIGAPINAGNIVMNMPGQGFFSFVSSTDGYPPYELTGSAMVLAELEIIGQYFHQVSICVGEGALYAVSGEDWLVMNPSSGDWDLPVATINGLAPVGVESESWGGVKALYR
jgi:hypothetical protein